MITIIGAGLVGSAIIDDIGADHDIAVFDKSKAALSGLDVRRKFTDDVFSRKEILTRSDLVISTLPGSIAYAAVKKLIGMGRSVVDTSFMEEDPFTLDKAAKRQKALYIPDAGYAPGITNVLAGRLYKKEEVESIEIIVGGLPVKTKGPFRHAVTFNVEGLIDEYTRPARIVRDGKIQSVDPLSDISPLSFDDMGEFDSFYSDGLRTLLKTVKVRNMYEKTLRYSGHLQAMKLLRDFGFFSKSATDGIVPRNLTEALFKSYGTDFRDLCLTRVAAGNGKRFEYVNIDRYNARTRTRSMARMTGYAAASAARVVLDGIVDVTGVYAPEYLGFVDREFNAFMSHLAKKGIRFSSSSA